ncbi:MAG TPA: hypothetical protein VEW64_03850 [Methyloceanibacter sp.]|jgi:hypothetical protein|nr:hypothetical protein [Methyloceanibacter sp.]
MWGLIVSICLVFGFSPALAAVDQGPWLRYAQHAADLQDSGGGGHALDSTPIDVDAAVQESHGGGGQCKRADGTLSYFLCQAQATLFGSIERVLLPLMILLALLALSTLALWFYTRRAANAARIAAEYVPAVERAYVFGGPTDLFLLHDQASVRLAMQNYGRTPAVVRGWLVEFVAQEPHGKKPAYDAAKRTDANEILEPDKLFSPATTFRSEIPAPFFIIGYIAYDDVFRKPHVTRFCVGVARDGKAGYAGHPAWNAYD